MKSRFIIPALGAALVISLGALTGCSDDYTYDLEGSQGSVAITATLNSDVKVVSRTDANELREKYGSSLLLWLTRPGKGPVRQYNGVDNLPSSPVALQTGEYVAEAWAGDSVSATFDDSRYFKAYQPFTIVKGATTPVDVTLKVANTLVAVDYDQSADDVLKSYQMTVGHSKGQLVFEGRDEREGCFMMPKADKTLTLKLEGTTLDGEPYTQEAAIENCKPGYKYIVHVSHKGTIEPIGGAYFDIVVDASEIEVEDQITISLAPEIKGINFDITQPQTAEQGNVGRKSIYVTATDALTGLVIESDELTTLIGHRNLDVITTSNAQYVEQLAQKGIGFQRVTAADGTLTNMRINFEASYTATLGEGQHTYTITAHDGDKQSTAVFTIDVSNAPVTIAPATDIAQDGATLTANLVKPLTGSESLTFHYRDVTLNGSWLTAPATVAGETLTASIDNLIPGRSYEYYVTLDAFQTATTSFTTLDGPQLPNSGFENWQTSSTPYLIYGSDQNMYWDSGNHGSATMRKNVTTPDNSVKHSGSYSAKLASQFVGIGIAGKFAAGNIFAGKYLATLGTNGVLGWGRPFDSKWKPRALKGWVRYEPVAVTHTEIPDKCAKGDMDRGIIYIALVTDQTIAYESENWPQIVNTKTKEFFDPQGSNVVSYGVKLFDATSGSGMVEFEIPLEDVNPLLTFKNIIVVASASQYGDYFTGGNGSNMWIDDLHLVY